MNKATAYYSQNREDLVLASLFEKDEIGFYVDVGANHPTFDSVTKLFYEKGWSGINIEPIKKFHQLLCADRPKDINLNVGIGDKEGSLELREYLSEAGEGMSTFSKELKDSYEAEKHWATVDYEDYEVKIKKLSSILKEQQRARSISFMKIDVEGLEYEVIASNDWQKFRPKFLCIEANHVIRDWRPILKESSYRLFFNDGLNEYYYDSMLLKDFNYSYPQDFVMKYGDSVHWSNLNEIEELKNRSNKLKKLAETISKDPRSSIEQIIPQPQGLKNILKNAASSLDKRLLSINNQSEGAPSTKGVSTHGNLQKHLKNSLKTYRIPLLKRTISNSYTRARKVAWLILKRGAK